MSDAVPAAPAARYRVLVVEDDPDLRDSIAAELRENGYEVACAAHGAAALAMLRAGGPPPDVIVLDLVMPVMDGWSFRAEQRRDPRLASIPVLVLSASDAPASASLEVADHVRKPCESDAVLRGVARIVHGLEHGRTQMQRLAQADRLASLGLLAAGVAHEINNPLAYVTANLQFVRGQLAPGAEADEARLAEVRAALDEALEGARRIGAIVRDIRSISTADDARREALDPTRVLESAINIVGGELRRRARLVRKFAPTPRVEANDGRLAQVFVNLLVNAAHAMPEGRTDRNEVRVATFTGPDGEAVVEVSDTGAGIPPEVLARIFEPFYTTKPAGVGTGLGLSICRGIVTALGGDITIESTVGRGTTARVTLPPARPEVATRATERPSNPTPLPARPAPPSNALGAPHARILAVDDERGILRALERLLGRAHELVTVAGGHEALELLRADPHFDVILCDLLMPGMTGMELHAALTVENPELAARMVFMTGSAFSEQARDYVQALPAQTIAKPIDIAVLERVISAALAQRPAAPAI